MSNTKLLSDKDINRKIAGIGTSLRAIRANVQEVLLHIATKTVVDQDCSLYAKLLNRMEGADVKRAVAWITNDGFGKVGEKDGQYSVKMNNKARLAWIEEQGETIRPEKEGELVADLVLETLEADAPKWWNPPKKTGAEIKPLADRIISLAKEVTAHAEGSDKVKTSIASLDEATLAAFDAMRVELVKLVELANQARQVEAARIKSEAAIEAAAEKATKEAARTASFAKLAANASHVSIPGINIPGSA